MKVLTAFITLFSLKFALAAPAPIHSEHQIRLCDNKESIIEKLHLKEIISADIKNKKSYVYYIETKNRDYASLNWSIRVRVKSNKTEITVKKKLVAKDYSNSKYPNMVCEYDLHGPAKNYSCKIDASVSTKEFESVLKNQKKWTDLLDSDQHKFLKEDDALFENAVVFGTLFDERFLWDDSKLGQITVDLTHMVKHQENTFHEISIRYPINDKEMGIQFENFVKSTKIKTCENQIDWPINKFDLFDILN